ncbi:MAG: acyl-CoA mutase large subunit family protein [Melioribacteraceae bacterium]|nr:acyl-CoA mutase large subunit family protein [Melioribacteraceae bacterium]
MKDNIKLEDNLKLKNDFPPVKFEDWKNQAITDLKGADFNKKLLTDTYEQIKIKPIYTSDDIKDLKHISNLPGFVNYVRGSSVAGYLFKSWDIAQELPYTDTSEYNIALLDNLKRGQTAINIILNPASQFCSDTCSNNSMNFSNEGLAVSDYHSFEVIFRNIDISKYPLYIHCGFTSIPLLMMITAYADLNNIQMNTLSGAFEADPYNYLIKSGKLPVSLSRVFYDMKTSIQWADKNAPGIKVIGISGLAYNNAGCSTAQELAYILATSVDYINKLIDRGLTIDQIAPMIRITVGIGSNYFMEIAKLRSLRVLWSNIIDAYGGNDTSRKLTVHGRTSVYNKTVFDPHVNILRATTEALSAVVGGIDSLHTGSFDETYSVPDEFSRRIARNTQIILKEETHLDRLIDPAGGSYFVEKLTEELASNAWKEFQKIEEFGGMLKALQDNYPQKEIDSVVGLKNKDLRKRKKVIVGINMYSNSKENRPVLKADFKPDKSQKHKDKSVQIKSTRDQNKVNKAIKEFKDFQNLNDPSVIEAGARALSAGAEIAEIYKASPKYSSEAVSIETLHFHRAADQFESLKYASLQLEEMLGRKPSVFLANMGVLKQYKARADFARSFFEVAMFNVISSKGFNTAGEAAEALLNENAEFVVVCSSDDKYPGTVPELAAEIKKLKPGVKIILAGYPVDQIQMYKDAGVDEFIYLGCDAYDILSRLIESISGRTF